MRGKQNYLPKIRRKKKKTETILLKQVATN
jgi:hypothetical protein